MSISAAGIDFSKLYETQSTGNHGVGTGNNIPAQPATEQTQGSEMQKFMKDVDFSKLKLQ